MTLSPIPQKWRSRKADLLSFPFPEAGERTTNLRGAEYREGIFQLDRAGHNQVRRELVVHYAEQRKLFRL